MARSLFDQDLQIHGSESYDDAIGGVNDATTAEGQTSLEGDLNVLRTLVSDLLGETNWYDAPDLSLKGVYDKQFVYLRHESGFEGVSVSGTSTTAFDTTIKAITGHANGAGSSTVSGVVVNATRPYRIALRDATTQNAFDDGLSNEVYGTLSWDGTNYVVSFFSNQDGTAVAYDFTSAVGMDISSIVVSAKFQELPWDRFIETSFHDVVGLVGALTDDIIVVDGMTHLLNGLTSQAQVNAKLDDLGSTANGEGASLIAIEDASTWFSGTDVEGALNDIEAAIGGTAYNAINYSENNVLTDDLSVRANLEELDLKWGDLASTVTGEGASIVGYDNTSTGLTATDVQAAIDEVYGLIDDVNDMQRGFETLAAAVNAGVNYTLPGSVDYTPSASGVNLEVKYGGQVLIPGAAFDYVEVAGSPSTQIQFNFTAKSGRNVDVRSFKNT